MHTDSVTRLSPPVGYGGLAIALVVASILSLSSGAYPVAVGQIIDMALRGFSDDTTARFVVLDVRVPRLLLGALTGAVLAVSGALLQGLFRNPLADPGLIGVSSGAALAAVAVIVLGGSGLAGWSQFAGQWALPLAAFAGGTMTTLIAWKIAHQQGQTSVALLLLAGIAINAIAGAGTGLLTYYADDSALRSLTFWSMGSLAHARWADLWVAGPWMVATLLIAPLLARPLDAFLMGEPVAGHLGYSTNWVKRGAVLLAALGVGAAVAVTGLIGFVGLVVPHLLRQLFGAGHRLLLPACALGGSALLVLADCLARVVVAPAELPIGLVMALLGGPFFLFLLMRHRFA
ncbi:iron complex transport system permease protein [Tamilnaduibacter salinus]|uniref:Iron ABC transporter n=1 Tax=Tamilnaduibacter salinus TaxID=1484056 RepID=A0A2A2I205_9GAMM|nr:iron ABC transporter permease [Tamilnaduibacter salinus]PAV25632.1 iron ABC transporter [Tamilnaduibacter salinus]PVY78119.1 iron complex transport system permease protein [Tamilnaduibacter salinus]